MFIAEIDTVFDGGEAIDDKETVVSLVQIFRIRDDRIAQVRDYFTPDLVD